jgi:hypothetical protein
MQTCENQNVESNTKKPSFPGFIVFPSLSCSCYVSIHIPAGRVFEKAYKNERKKKQRKKIKKLFTLIHEM